jgi:hypothetical protein
MLKEICGGIVDFPMAKVEVLEPASELKHLVITT